jgi:CopG family nickel-responsive transcriptional regulator
MERFTISLDSGLAREFDGLIAERGYDTRSEAVRDLIRRELEQQRLDSGEGADCVANLSYVYNHHERELADRLTQLQHEHHDLCVSNMHAHLDHEHCIETLILRGPTEAVRRFADRVAAQRGVRHGKLNLVSVEVSARGAHRGDDHPHVHVKPR